MNGHLDITGSDASGRGCLALRSVWKCFRVGNRLGMGGAAGATVGPVTFEVGRGEIAAIVGPNGSGKSTILRMIAGVVEPDGGEIVRPAGGIGYSSGQERSLYWDLSALENLIFAGQLAGLRVREARRQGQELLAHLGLGEMEHVPVKILSTGQRQRVLVARALMGDPAVVLLDEPTGNMDEEGRNLVWVLLEERGLSGSVVVLSSHDVSEIVRANLVERLPAVGGARVGSQPATVSGSIPLQNVPMFRQVCAFIWRDMTLTIRRPWGQLLLVLSGLISIISIYFLSRAVGPGGSYLAPYAHNYFGFAVLGILLAEAQHRLGSALAGGLRLSFLDGTFESLVASGGHPLVILMSPGVWTILLLALQSGLALAVIHVLFGLHVEGLDLSKGAMVAGILVVVAVAWTGLSLLEMATVLIWKRGIPIQYLVTVVTGLLGGVLFPIAVLPPSARLVSGLLPISPALSGIRDLLLRRSSADAVGALLHVGALSVVYLLAGIVVSSAALALARRRGTLGHF